MAQRRNRGVYWVGTYIPASGLSINAYLIIDEYPTLINTGAPSTIDNLIKKVQSIIDLKDLQYIVLNQAGVGYAGGLTTLAGMAPGIRIVTTEYEAFRLGLYGLFIQPLIVQDDDTLNIGRIDLRFYSAAFVGSPDAMFVFDSLNGILFSGEAFSAVVSRWETVNSNDITELLEAYYDTRIGDSRIAQDAISRLKSINVRLIAPGHGPMLVRHTRKYIDALSKGFAAGLD